MGAAGCSDYGISGSASDNEGGDPAPEVLGSCDLTPPGPPTVASPGVCVSEPQPGTFTPVVEWQWSNNELHVGFDQVMAQPVVANLNDDNGDGQIDAADVPDIVFASYAGMEFRGAGALVAVSGATKDLLWSIREVGGHQPYATTSVAVGDLEADGVPEIVFSSLDGVTAVHSDGSLAWHADVEAHMFGMPAIGDIDADGIAEVMYGRTVIGADGGIVWAGAEGGGAFASSYAADLDGDGLSEVVAGAVVYSHDGTVRFHNPFGDGLTALGDLDRDGRPELITVGDHQVGVIDDEGIVLWTFPLSDFGGGPPTVADFDGDGEPEIGVASKEFYRVLDADGTELWANAVQDYSSGKTGSSVFDFEGDGGAEVVYADEETLWVFDGATGEVEMAWDHHSSGTLMEYPVIVDIDSDGSAEIIVANNHFFSQESTGIVIIGDADDSWAPARPVWNQHAYSVTNIADDGSVPVNLAPNWNSFRAGSDHTTEGYDQPDLAIGEPTVCSAECHDERLVAWVPVVNQAEATARDVVVEIGAERFVLGELAGGTGTWAGPVMLSTSELEEGVEMFVTSAGALECDLADNRRTWTRMSCAG